MAQAANWTRLYADIDMHAPGVVNPVTAQPEVMNLFQDFCQKTNIWTQTQDIAVSPAANTYPLTFPTGSAIKRITSMRDITNGLNAPWLGVKWPITLVPPATMQLGWALSNTYTWRVQTTLFPVDPPDSDGNPMVPDWILDQHYDTLLNGALYHLCRQKAKSYSDMQIAAASYKLYAKGRGEATAAVLAANMYGGQAWFYPQAGVTTGRQRGV